MYLLKSILSLIIILGSFSAVAQKGGKETVTIQTNIHCDHCQKCESCGPRIYKHLMDTKGVRKVKISEEEAAITVTYKSDELTSDDVRDALNAAGFDADDQPAPAEAVARLDACCRKG